MPKSDIATISPLLLVAGLLVPSFASHYVTVRKCTHPCFFSPCAVAQFADFLLHLCATQTP